MGDADHARTARQQRGPFELAALGPVPDRRQELGIQPGDAGEQLGVVAVVLAIGDGASELALATTGDYISVFQGRRVGCPPAAVRRTSLAKLLEDSLRKYLADDRAARDDTPTRASMPVVDAGPPVGGVDFNDTSALWDL